MGARHTLHRLATGAALAAVLAAGGCGSDAQRSASGPDPTGPPSDAATVLTLPPSAGTPLLTFTGKLDGAAPAPSGGGVGGGGPAVPLDRTAIDSLNRIELTVSDPFQKKQLGYKGVWLADLLPAVGVSESATNLHMTALDDYVVDIPMSDVRAGGIFFAVQNLDGSPIPVSDGGPTRIVFRDGTPSGANSEQWIWSLTTIEVQ